MYINSNPITKKKKNQEFYKRRIENTKRNNRFYCFNTYLPTNKGAPLITQLPPKENS